MSALPQPDREIERFPRLYAVGEETTDLANELERRRRWALGHTETGEYDLAERDFTNVLFNMPNDDPAQITILFERSAMYERREWFWCSHQDLQAIKEFLALNPGPYNAETLLGSAAIGMARLKTTMDELTWPVRVVPYIDSGTYVGLEHGSD